jgi:hypothetical protein
MSIRSLIMMAASNLRGDDPYFSGVTLLMHMDGSDTGTTFIDVTGKTAINNGSGGSVTTSATQKKFGTASGWFRKAFSTYLTVPDDADFDFGTGDWTFECWAYDTDDIDSDEHCLLSFEYGGDEFRLWRRNSTAGPTASGRYELRAGGTGLVNAIDQRVQNTWQHIAAARASGTVRLFIDGVLQGSASYSNNMDCTSVVTVGNTSGGDCWDGYIDDVRITKGFARYTTDFDPPTAAFPDQ